MKRWIKTFVVGCLLSLLGALLLMLAAGVAATVLGEGSSPGVALIVLPVSVALVPIGVVTSAIVASLRIW